MPERIPGGAVDLSHLVAKAQAGQAGAAGPAGAAASTSVIDIPAAVFEATDLTFEPVSQLSQVVPVVINLYSATSDASAKLGPILAKITRETAGRVVLAMVDVDANPGLAQAFQVQSLPTVVALINGQPVPLFQGVVPEDQLRELFGRIVELGQQQGLTGRVNAPDLAEGFAGEPVPAEPVVPPAHREAVDAIERGDYAGAVAAYEAVIARAPRDEEARAALVQVRLLLRLDGIDAGTIREAASAAPTDVAAQMSVADLDVSGGHVEDGFLRLLECYPTASEDDQARLRERLVELFEVVGVTDPRVIAARRRLASLLY